MMYINMEIEMGGVGAFKEGEDDDRIFLDGFDTFLERREVYYLYQAIPPIQADGGRKVYGEGYYLKVYGEAYANINDNVLIEPAENNTAKENMKSRGDMEFIPDGMNSSEWIDALHNEVVVGEIIIDEAIEVDQSIAEETKIHNNKKGSVLRGKKINNNKKGSIKEEEEDSSK